MRYISMNIQGCPLKLVHKVKCRRMMHLECAVKEIHESRFGDPCSVEKMACSSLNVAFKLFIRCSKYQSEIVCDIL